MINQSATDPIPRLVKVQLQCSTDLNSTKNVNSHFLLPSGKGRTEYSITAANGQYPAPHRHPPQRTVT
jgi:hypothetical protein